MVQEHQGLVFGMGVYSPFREVSPSLGIRVENRMFNHASVMSLPSCLQNFSQQELCEVKLNPHSFKEYCISDVTVLITSVTVVC